MTESQLEKKLVAFCREHGLLTYKFSSPSHRGVPDRIIMGRGKVMFLELKRPGNVPTALQRRTGKEIDDHGCFWAWADNFTSAKTLVCHYFGLGFPDGV